MSLQGNFNLKSLNTLKYVAKMIDSSWNVALRVALILTNNIHHLIEIRRFNFDFHNIDIIFYSKIWLNFSIAKMQMQKFFQGISSLDVFFFQVVNLIR